VVATLPFEVRAYNVTPKQRCRFQVDTIVQNLSSSVYYVGDYLGVDGLNPDCTVAGGGFNGVSDPAAATFQLRITSAAGGPTFDGPKLIDASTGQMLLRPGLMSAGVEYNAELQVRDGARSAPFARWTITPRRHVDLDATANGPNGRDCARGARVDTGDQYDSRYTCDCAGTDFAGDNCDVSAASELALILGAGLGAVLCSIMIALAATRLQLYRLKHRPVDMGAVRGDVLAGLGIGAAFWTTSLGSCSSSTVAQRKTGMQMLTYIERSWCLRWPSTCRGWPASSRKHGSPRRSPGPTSCCWSCPSRRPRWARPTLPTHPSGRWRR